MAFDVKFYMSVFWRRFHYFIFVAALVSATGIFVAMVLPATYKTEALLLVESEQISGDLAESTVRTGTSELLQTIQQRLMSRSALLEMANELNIYPDSGAMNPEDIVADMRARTVFQRNIKDGEATTVQVSFEAETGALSAQVTNAFVTRILKENRRLRTGRADDTLEFFEQEEERLGRDLDRTNAAILEFKLANKNSLPDSLDFRRTRQVAEQERLLRLLREEADLKDKRRRLVEFYENTGKVDLPNENLTLEEGALQQARADLQNALAIFSTENPRVKVLRAQVEKLEATVAAQKGGATTNQENAGETVFDIQIKEIDGQMAFITRQIDSINLDLKALEVSIDKTPENSIRLAELERDYNNSRVLYDQTIAALAKAKTGEIIETRAKGQRIAVIEQAIAPDKPTSPNRVLIAAGSVAAGIFLGLGLIILLEMLNRSIRRPVEITNKLGITPIATLPFVRTRGEVFRRSLIVYLAMAMALIGVPAMLYAIHTYYMPMDILIERVLSKVGLNING